MSGGRSHAVADIQTFSDTSCILAWLIEQGYEVYAFLADVGQEEVGGTQNHKETTDHLSRRISRLPARKPSKLEQKSSS